MSFDLRVEPGAAPTLTLILYDAAGVAGASVPLNDLGGAPLPGAWKTYDVPLSRMGAAGRRVVRLAIQGFNPPADPVFYVDRVAFLPRFP